jgi:RNA polymerase sigma factor (sigma-70 family)
MENLSKQFSAIYDQYIEKIYRFVYLKVNSEEVAQDITSKVFLKGWEAYKNQGDSIKNPGAFLYQIARNSVVDHYREKGRTRAMSVDFIAQIADPATSAHDKAILNADIRVIKTAMHKLKKNQQDIIIWHYLEDMPITDIAKLLNKPAGTVRVALHRGLKDLKNMIKES